MMQITKMIVAFLVVISAPLLSAVILYIPPERITKNVATLISSLVWPYLSLLVITMLWTHIDKILFFVTDAFRSGSITAIKLSSFFELNLKDVEKIPTPDKAEDTSLDNIALLHTSFITSKRPEGYDLSTTFYQFEV